MCVDALARRRSRVLAPQHAPHHRVTPHRVAVAYVCVLLVTAGCTPPRHGAPHGYLPTVEEAASSAYGCWVSLETRDSEAPLAGELIAAQMDSLWILTLQDTLVSLSTFDVAHVAVVTHLPNVEGLIGWTVLGTLSSGSHGALLVISAPMWVVAGSISSSAFAHSGSIGLSPQGRPWNGGKKDSTDWNSLNDTEYTPNIHTRLNAYARFPMGMPPHLDRSVLRSKPYLPLSSHPAANQWQIDER